MKVYTDANYAGSIVDRRSTTGYCMFLGGNLVTWRSKKQNVVARSSAEAEFRAMAQGVCELLWMKIILDDLKIKYEAPMGLVCDNKSAISIAHNPVQHDRTKHIEIDRHFIKEKLDSGLIATEYIPSKLQLADMFTKGLPTEQLQDLTCKLEMIDIHSPVHLETLVKPTNTSSSSLAFSGTSQAYALSVLQSTAQGTWVVDTGATDCMTHSSTEFISYRPCPNNKKIATADGTLITVVGKGDILLS